MTIDRRTISKIKKMCEAHPDEVLRILLKTPFWPKGLQTKTGYMRYEDDARMAYIGVLFSEDGDFWIEVMSQKDPEDFGFLHRFRNYFGGGQSLRITAALRLLAVAINLDNKEFPQNRKPEEEGA